MDENEYQRIYKIGGYDFYVSSTAQYRKYVQIYHIHNDSWSLGAELIIESDEMSCHYSNKKIYVFGMCYCLCFCFVCVLNMILLCCCSLCLFFLNFLGGYNLINLKSIQV